jgi:hypothetical protein
MNTVKLREFLILYLVDFLICFAFVGGWTYLINQFRLDVTLIICVIMSLFVTTIIIGQHVKEEIVREELVSQMENVNMKLAKEYDVKNVDVEDFLNHVEEIAIERLKRTNSIKCDNPCEWVEYIQPEMSNVLQAILIINLQRGFSKDEEKTTGDTK